MSDIRLSIVICTFNRAQFLRRLLLSLFAQIDAAPDVELIVVDNNCGDNTHDVVCEFMCAQPRILYAREDRQGLSNARNCGATKARGAHLLFVDDDALAPKGYVEAMRRAVEYNPDFFGGPIYPIYADRKPINFPEQLEIRKKADTQGFHRHVTMSGGNFGVRKSVLTELGGFDPAYGMTGDKLGMLEERILLNAYKLAKPMEQQSLYYALDGYLFHHTPAERMTYEFQRRRTFFAEYRMFRHLLASGARAPWMHFWAAARRFAQALAARVRTMISPRSVAEARFKSKLLLWWAFAGAAAAGVHLWRRALVGEGRRPRELCADRPLRVLWVQTPWLSHSSSDACKARLAVREAIAGASISIETIEFAHAPSIAELLASLNAASPFTFDALLVEQELPAPFALAARAYHPHLQFIVRLSRTRLMTAFDNMDVGKRGLGALKRCLPILATAFAEDRATVGHADIVVASCQGMERNYLRLLGFGRKIAFWPGRRKSDLNAAPDQVKSEAHSVWAGVIRDCRRWMRTHAARPENPRNVRRSPPG